MGVNLLQGSREYPYHVSVGAVLVNNEGKVCTHYFDQLKIGPREAKDFYILMRETPEPGESISNVLERGLREEFGAVATTRHYIGSLVSILEGVPTLQEKTTLYFLCDVVSQDASLRLEVDSESSSKLEWCDIDFLIEKMRKQGQSTGYQDIDESRILERTKQLVSL